ncbi:hypothetical protein GOODEAATRI_030316 [Goodea atripinnis]|uniref:Uncharacterized protein n=1 Tax=Goodea atripinnis TaxID=208336 RepID=A0ABV0P8Y7_9TELE
MSSGRLHIKRKRVCARKRSRDVLKTHLTAVRKQGRGAGDGSPPCAPCRRSSSMAEGRVVEVPRGQVDQRVGMNENRSAYCSDSEDLFGDYDSILEDSSILAKLEDAEQHKILQSENLQSFRTLQPSKDLTSQSPEDRRTDSVFDELEDNAFEELPPSQLQFQEQIQDQAKRSRLQARDKISTPSHSVSEIIEGAEETNAEDRSKRQRRSVADQLKKTMLGNAATPVGVSRTAALKEAVVSEEISVAMQAMEAICAETTDLGPFFGLPSKVKELMHKLRGIQSLYGENNAHQKNNCRNCNT